MSYKDLSLIQVVFICLVAFSVLDYGYAITSEQSDGLFFNKIMFADGSLIGEIFFILKEADLWGVFQFWAYGAFIVALCQLIKAYIVEVY